MLIYYVDEIIISCSGLVKMLPYSPRHFLPTTEMTGIWTPDP